MTQVENSVNDRIAFVNKYPFPIEDRPVMHHEMESFSRFCQKAPHDLKRFIVTMTDISRGAPEEYKVNTQILAKTQIVLANLTWLTVPISDPNQYPTLESIRHVMFNRMLEYAPLVPGETYDASLMNPDEFLMWLKKSLICDYPPNATAFEYLMHCVFTYLNAGTLEFEVFDLMKQVHKNEWVELEIRKTIASACRDHRDNVELFFKRMYDSLVVTFPLMNKLGSKFKPKQNATARNVLTLIRAISNDGSVLSRMARRAADFNNKTSEDRYKIYVGLLRHVEPKYMNWEWVSVCVVPQPLGFYGVHQIADSASRARDQAKHEQSTTSWWAKPSHYLFTGAHPNHLGAFGYYTQVDDVFKHGEFTCDGVRILLGKTEVFHQKTKMVNDIVCETFDIIPVYTDNQVVDVFDGKYPDWEVKYLKAKMDVEVAELKQGSPRNYSSTDLEAGRTSESPSESYSEVMNHDVESATFQGKTPNLLEYQVQAILMNMSPMEMQRHYDDHGSILNSHRTRMITFVVLHKEIQSGHFTNNRGTYTHDKTSMFTQNGAWFVKCGNSALKQQGGRWLSGTKNHLGDYTYDGYNLTALLIS